MEKMFVHSEQKMHSIVKINAKKSSKWTDVIPDFQSNCPDLIVADPGSGAFLTPGSGMGLKSGSGSGMNNPVHISESLKNYFFALKYINFWRASGIRDEKKIGSGMEKSRVRDPG